MPESQTKSFKKELGRLYGFDWIWGQIFLREITCVREYCVGNVLDIGCGTKPYRHIFPVQEYWGIDLPRVNAIPDIHASALALPIADQSIDLCFSMWLLDDLADPEVYLAELFRVLRPGGHAVLVEIQSFPEHDAPNDYWRFTRYGLLRLGEQAGLHTIKILPIGGFWAGVGIHFTSFFLRGMSGYHPIASRIVAPAVNGFFIFMDKINYMPRGTFAHIAVFEKLITL